MSSEEWGEPFGAGEDLLPELMYPFCLSRCSCGNGDSHDPVAGRWCMKGECFKKSENSDAMAWFGGRRSVSRIR
jgi:hypothetical protein